MSESQCSSFTNNSTQGEPEADDVMKILLATDTHLGYGEKDGIRCDDSFIAFEEVLQHAVENGVDFILLGGDLFHDASPSSSCINKCIKLLRTYCLGDKEIQIEFLSDQTLNFAESLTQSVNYQDPNMNVSIPVYSIHGNHDDVTGFGHLSTLDVLSSAGLINYFGKCHIDKKIDVHPIILKKGETQIALYGLGHIHDARLARLFQESKVILQKPDGDDWFHFLVLHQNRADRGRKNYLPDEVLPNFLDLVLWGHEHDCRIVPEKISKNEIYITQPGSSVATSLAEGESQDKHCGLLLVNKKSFKLEPIKLKTVRPFLFKAIDLEDYSDDIGGDMETKTQELCFNIVKEMIENAKEKISDNPNQPNKPLIRLRVLYYDEVQMFNAIRFGQQFANEVANPMDLIAFKKNIQRAKRNLNAPLDKGVLNDAMGAADDEQARVEDVVDKYFADVDADQQLDLFYSQSLSEMCRRLVDNDDESAAKEILKYQKNRACKFLEENSANEDNIEEILNAFRDDAKNIHNDMLKFLDNQRNNASNYAKPNANASNGNSDVEILDDDSDNDKPAKKVPAARGKGSRGGKSARGGAKTSAKGARGSKAKNVTATNDYSASMGLNIQVNTSATSRATSRQTIQQPTPTPKSRSRISYTIEDSS